jgi:hypothetical protein
LKILPDYASFSANFSNLYGIGGVQGQQRQAGQAYPGGGELEEMVPRIEEFLDQTVRDSEEETEALRRGLFLMEKNAAPA